MNPLKRLIEYLLHPDLSLSAVIRRQGSPPPPHFEAYSERVTQGTADRTAKSGILPGGLPDELLYVSHVESEHQSLSNALAVIHGMSVCTLTASPLRSFQIAFRVLSLLA